MENKKAASLKTEIYDSILRDIIEGTYKQNEIINEKQLIEKYKVSKSPIRDALIELCSEGVLISHPRYGYEVVRINEKEMRDIVDFRVMIETACLRTSVKLMKSGDISELRAYTLTECCSKAPETSALVHWNNNSHFHLRLLSYSRNEYCYRMLQKSIGIMTRAYAQRLWERWGTVQIEMGCENHLKIIDDLLAGNIDQAAEELRQDIVSFLDILYPDYGTVSVFR